MEGTYRKDRAARNEPKPRVRVPAAPKWLDGEGRKEYRRVAKMLADLRVMTEADATALATYAQQYGKWLEAEAMVKEQGAVLVSDKGSLYLNPWQNVASMAIKNMTKFMAEFGLTPASRSRIEAAPDTDENRSLAEMLMASVGVSTSVGDD